MDDARTLLRRYGLRPRKSLGQNFLVDPAALSRIITCASVTEEDTVLEVGAGLGTLTVALAERAAQVIAVETDPHLAQVLRQELSGVANVQLIHGDILELDPAALLRMDVPRTSPALALWGPRLPRYLVVANLPYYITNAVVRHLLEAKVRPERLVLTVQREVAQRMVAGPGAMSLLSVSVQFYGRPALCARIGRGAFFPAPKVASAVVRIDSYEQPPVAIDDIARFFRIVRAGFAQRRKQLHNTLAAGLGLPGFQVVEALQAQGLDPRARAETLSIEAWGRVYQAIAPYLA